MRTLLVALIALMLTSPASAKEFRTIPDLRDLVISPIRATYFLICDTNVAEAILEGQGIRLLTDREVKMPSNEVTIRGFPGFTMRVMLHDWGLKTDRIPTFILVDLCVEDKTTLEVEDPEGLRPDKTPRIDPDGKPHTGPSLWPQKTR